jgi:hypothetical protein
VPAASTSITGAPPGYTDLEVPATGSVTITNKTPGRTANLSDFNNLEFGPLYASSSPLCNGATASNESVALSRLTVTAGANPGTYCYSDLVLGFQINGGLGGSLASGSSVTANAYSAANFNATMTLAQATPLVNAFNQESPAFWAFAVAGSPVFTGQCQYGGNDFVGASPTTSGALTCTS